MKHVELRNQSPSVDMIPAENINQLFTDVVRCSCLFASSIAKMRCFAVSVGAVHNDSTVSVVSFDIAGTLTQKVGASLPASAAPPTKCDLTSREFSEVLAADSVGR